jgi:hypothetical protein
VGARDRSPRTRRRLPHEARLVPRFQPSRQTGLFGAMLSALLPDRLFCLTIRKRLE